jgi:hypothetical protein
MRPLLFYISITASLLLSSCSTSIEEVNKRDPSRIPEIRGDTHKERVGMQEEIIRQQDRELAEKEQEIRHHERQLYYNELMRLKGGAADQ